MKPVIELTNITKQFNMRQETSFLWRFLSRRKSNEEIKGDSHKVVLDNISLTVNQGERLAIIGRNGAGKSTLLKIISRILTPDKGNLMVRGTISSLLELGVGFHPDLSGSDNIYFYGALMGKNRAQVREVYDSICDFADIGKYIEQPVKTYSSGMYQRLAFSCAFAMEPDILIADEGLSVGDFLFQQKCFDRIDQIVANGTTFLIVAHSARQLQRIATRGIWLENGRIEMDGDINSVHDAYTKFLIFEQRVLAKEAELKGTEFLPGLELEQKSNDENAVKKSQSMIVITNGKSLSDTDPWKIGAFTELEYEVDVKVPNIFVRTRVTIIDVSDDLPLVENLYMVNTPYELTQGAHRIKVKIPPLYLRNGTYKCLFEIYEDENKILICSAEPILFFSKRRILHKENSYVGLYNVQITIQSITDEKLQEVN